ncbi:rRNA maturation RNase YbeY [Thermosipho ferrireducens]|uniref:Endoribonuclease YbeY n=1 Tax=Thermosipho ferrireducens TaxID=2571116 RepID=A0ABX7S8N1_9BACT|nr:rRNA maturation RNase YbeY [Thermosipho ferrireducens]QTA38165.1 rRNA maturation RNase YbeY [Thermosipho ferrireducens]
MIYLESKENIESALLKAMENVLKEELGKDVNVNLITVDKNTIAQLNKQYRDIQSPTDVLTFVYGEEDVYAEVYICTDVIKENSVTYNNSFKKELLTVLIHAALHISGYDHEYDTSKEKEMFQKQSEYLKKFESLL